MEWWTGENTGLGVKGSVLGDISPLFPLPLLFTVNTDFSALLLRLCIQVAKYCLTRYTAFFTPFVRLRARLGNGA